MYEYRVVRQDFADKDIGTLWVVQKKETCLIPFLGSEWKKMAVYTSPMLATQHYEKLMAYGGEVKETVYLPQ